VKSIISYFDELILGVISIK